MPVKQPNWWIKLQTTLTADPKKTGVLGLLTLVLLIMAGRILLKGNTAPASAGAKAVDMRVPGAANRTPGGIKPLVRRDGAPKSMQEWLTSKKKPIGERNLFAVRLEYYPRDVKTPTGSTARSEGFWEEVAKSLPSQADQKKERQILVENLQLKAAELKLQTTVMGAVPKALVNGELVGEGDVVASGSGENRTPFRVLRIEARRIIVEREGIRLEIPMK